MLYIALIIAAGALLRFFGLFHDFWLDEIWTYLMVSELPTPVRIFTSLSLDHHHLNSLYIYLAGTGQPAHWFKYRLLSFGCGIALPAAVYALAQKMFRDRRVALCALLLSAVSYPLVLYSVEARGYAPLLLFSVLTVYFLGEYCDGGRRWALRAFQASFVFGFLSHLQFVVVAVGAFVFSCSRVFRSEARAKERCAALITMFLLPGAIVLALLGPFLLHRQSGGMPVQAAAAILSSFLNNFLGLSLPLLLASAELFFLLAVVLMELRYLAKRDTGYFSCMFTILVMPAVVITIKALTGKPDDLCARHIIVTVPFLILLVSRFLIDLASFRRYGKYVSVAIALLIIGGSVVKDIRFLVMGRGGHGRALASMCDASRSGRVMVSSDSDFRTPMIIDFYKRFCPEGKDIVYIPSDKIPAGGTEWFIAECLPRNYAHSGATPARYITLRNGAHYRMEKEYPCFEGTGWVVYRLLPPDKDAPGLNERREL